MRISKWTRLAGVILAAVPVAVIAQASSGGLPARLTDAEFNAIRLAMSEAGFSFTSNNFTSNEETLAGALAALRTRRETGGAYIGVGPEQNFSYIASLKPDIAFVVDIRREAIVQHLLYKALFELSRDRAEFISLLFSRPRPAGVDSATSIHRLWAAYWPIAMDSARITETLRRVVDHVTGARGIPLDSASRITILYQLTAFAAVGPMIAMELPSWTDTVPLLADRLPNPARVSIRVRDATTGAPVPGVQLRWSCPWCGRTAPPTDSTGYARSAPWPIGTTLLRPYALIPGAAGYDTVRLADLRLDRPETTLAFSLVRNSACQVLPERPLVCAPLQASAALGRGASPVAGRGGGGGAGAAAPATLADRMTAAESASTVRGARLASLPVRPLPADIRGVFGGSTSMTTGFAPNTSVVDSAGNPLSFLGTEFAFREVKDRHERNLIIPLVGDFAGTVTLRSIGEYLRQRGAVVRAFYVSNVESALGGETPGLSGFYDNLAALPTSPESFVVRWTHGICSIASILAAAAPPPPAVFRAGTCVRPTRI